MMFMSGCRGSQVAIAQNRSKDKHRNPGLKRKMLIISVCGKKKETNLSPLQAKDSNLDPSRFEVRCSTTEPRDLVSDLRQVIGLFVTLAQHTVRIRNVGSVVCM